MQSSDVLSSFLNTQLQCFSIFSVRSTAQALGRGFRQPQFINKYKQCATRPSKSPSPPSPPPFTQPSSRSWGDMPRIIFVSGFHPSTRARDLAYEFER